MSRKIRRSARSAATSCNRLDLRPSRRVAAAGACWWSLVLLVILASNAPGPLRFILALLLLLSIPAMFRFMLLRGRKAVRRVEWNGQGEYFLGLGPGRRRVAATLARHQSLGLGLWTLEFLTPEGRLRVLVDTGLHPRNRIRRLGRALRRGELIPSRPKV
jgi:hypothetical protein